MGASLGTQIFWMLCIGLLVGFAGHYLFGHRGMKLMTSLIMATLGSVIVGLIAYFFQFNVTLAYSLFGAAALLFIPNAFQQKEKIPTIKKTD